MNWNLARKAKMLNARATIIQKMRTFFVNRGYLEIETPLLIPAPAPESHIDPFAAGQFFLQTSPELCMKRLLAAGYNRIFQISHCWRSNERGALHLPEFTMLEWYCTYADYRYLMAESIELLKVCSENYTNDGILSYKNSIVNMSGRVDYITVKEAFLRYTDTTMEIAINDGNFDTVMTESIEPYLGTDCPTIIYDYPAERAALSKIKTDDPTVAERFEIYIAGVELANAFTELTDPEIQRSRFTDEIAQRFERGAIVTPMPEPFLSEISEMPESAGIALGVDRLIMLLTGSETIDDVVAFTPEDL